MKPERAVALHEEAYRILGVDLTTIPGTSVLHVQAILSELGPDLTKSEVPLHSVRGWDSAPITTSTEEEYFRGARARSRIASHTHFGWQRAIVGCEPGLDPPGQLPRLRTSSLALSITFSRQEKLMTIACLPKRKKNIGSAPRIV